jgi:hypothetical protein
MSRIISFDSEGNDITCMKEFDALAYPCSACDNEDCTDREIDVPFNIIKQQDEELVKDVNRFMELSEKYKDNIDEVLEFANLCMRFYPIKRNKYKEV